MKITWNGGNPKIQRIDKAKAKGLGSYGKLNTGSIKGKDEVSISSKAKDFSSVMKALKNVPDMREDKVVEFTKQMELGQYNRKGIDIADKILSNLDKDISEQKYIADKRH